MHPCDLGLANTLNKTTKFESLQQLIDNICTHYWFVLFRNGHHRHFVVDNLLIDRFTGKYTIYPLFSSLKGMYACENWSRNYKSLLFENPDVLELDVNGMELLDAYFAERKVLSGDFFNTEKLAKIERNKAKYPSLHLPLMFVFSEKGPCSVPQTTLKEFIAKE